MEFEHIPATDEQPPFRRAGPPPKKFVPPKAPPKWTKGFPLKENCDPKNPFEAFLWMLVALPGQNGAALVMPPEYLQLVSERLWALGARPVAEPTLKYRRPTNLDPNWMTAPGTWVDINAPDDDDRTAARKAVDSLIPVQKAELFRELSKDMTPRERFNFLNDIMRETAGEYEEGSGE